MLEKQIESEILSFLKMIGAFVWKNDSTGIYDPIRKKFRTNKNIHRIKGVSDIIGIFQGRFLAIEVKSKTGAISPEQRVFLAQVNNEGGIAFVARSLQQCIDQLFSHFPQDERLKRIVKGYKGGRTLEQ